MSLILNRRARDAGELAMPGLAPSAPQLLALGDAARDERRWTEAAELYGQYLVLRDGDPAIWVQFGHALKESGSHAEAEAAYKRGLELAPDIADTQLQLGHLYKRMRRLPDAITAYRAALRLDPALIDARRELAGLGMSANESFSAKDIFFAQLPDTLRAPGIFIDLSDVFFYLRHHKTVSGIQRVQLGIANAIIALPAMERAAIAFLTDTEDRRGYVVIDNVYIRELATELARDEVDHGRLIEVMRSATGLGRGYEALAGDTLLILGAFWVSENISERTVELARKGVRVGTLIHDIIPITHPEFCVTSLTETFTDSFLSVVRVASFVLTASDHTGRSLRAFIDRNQVPDVPIRTLKAAHKTWEPPPPSTAVSASIGNLIDEEYVLYVSTIEIRKNHIYLFRIWKRLLEQLGQRTPCLVLVGRPGWRVNDLIDQLNATFNLNGKIRILHDLSDAELAALYRSALFTVFPSFEEGWGLPVGESLMFGRPCIASSTSSVPEVAGEFVDYVDPFNDSDGYNKIFHFITDNEFRERRAKHIKENFAPRQWDDVARDMLDLIRSDACDLILSAKRVDPPRAQPSRMYRLGHRNDPSDYIASGDSTFTHFACDTGWDRVEDFGRWMRRRHASIAFTIGQGGGGPIVVMLEVFTVGWLAATRLRITANGVQQALVKLPPGERRLLSIEAIPDGGRVMLEFAPVGEIKAGPDPRGYLCFGVGSLGYAPSNDALSRVMLMEALLCCHIEKAAC